MRYFSFRLKTLELQIVTTLHKGGIYLRGVAKIAKLFSTKLLASQNNI